MIKHFSLRIVLAIFLLMSGSPAWGQSALAPSPTASPSAHKPKLAVTFATQETEGQCRENLEDLLTVELASQPFLELVDRQMLREIIKEHTIALANLNETGRALA
ncbi:MAG: hypothetical protein GX621_18055, partial [Pirellulaceae bacterium]|nr:hypothetical protein [Pirellulaceae bacterium]